MDADTYALCEMVRSRSSENRRAMTCLAPILHTTMSPAFSILRQELDSMIRVIYLLNVQDPAERQELIRATLAGERWRARKHEGGYRIVTDKEMVDLAEQLQGWTKSVYKFGCAFIHLSNFHNHLAQNPFMALADADRQDVLSHMRYYHGGPHEDDPSMEEIIQYLPRVFDKIAGNLECYVDMLERGETDEV